MPEVKELKMVVRAEEGDPVKVNILFPEIGVVEISAPANLGPEEIEAVGIGFGIAATEMKRRLDARKRPPTEPEAVAIENRNSDIIN